MDDSNEITTLEQFRKPSEKFNFLGIEMIVMGFPCDFMDAVYTDLSGTLIDWRFSPDNIPALLAENPPLDPMAEAAKYANKGMHPGHLTMLDYRLARKIYYMLGIDPPKEVLKGCMPPDHNL